MKIITLHGHGIEDVGDVGRIEGYRRMRDTLLKLYVSDGHGGGI
ncbi:MAG: hypothetical protein ACFFCW_23430 [Candidatus Hodarchaeota archaeon]